MRSLIFDVFGVLKWSSPLCFNKSLICLQKRVWPLLQEAQKFLKTGHNFWLQFPLQLLLCSKASFISKQCKCLQLQTLSPSEYCSLHFKACSIVDFNLVIFIWGERDFRPDSLDDPIVINKKKRFASGLGVSVFTNICFRARGIGIYEYI